MQRHLAAVVLPVDPDAADGREVVGGHGGQSSEGVAASVGTVLGPQAFGLDEHPGAVQATEPPQRTEVGIRVRARVGGDESACE